MTDYSYTNRVALTDSTSKNNATDVGGYPLDVSPDGSWPGLSADPNQQTLDTDKMLTIADALDSMVQTLQNSSVMSDVQSTASTSYGPQNWEAAVYLQQANKEVANTVANYTTQLIKNLSGASAAIRAAASGYTGAETTNVQSAQNQSNAIPGNSNAAL